MDEEGSQKKLRWSDTEAQVPKRAERYGDEEADYATFSGKPTRSKLTRKIVREKEEACLYSWKKGFTLSR